MPATEYIVVLEDDDLRANKIRSEIEKRISNMLVFFFKSALVMIAWLNKNLSSVRLILLDHDLGLVRKNKTRNSEPGTGKDVVKCLLRKKNLFARSCFTQQIRYLEDAGWTVERISPFSGLSGSRAFWSRIRSLLKSCRSVSIIFI